jgi:hypothetical protein
LDGQKPQGWNYDNRIRKDSTTPPTVPPIPDHNMPNPSSLKLNQAPISSSNKIDPQSSIIDRSPQLVIRHTPPVQQDSSSSSLQTDLTAQTISYYYPYSYSSLTVELFGNSPKYHFATAIVKTNE